MGLKKTFRNRAGVDAEFSRLNKVTFLNNKKSTYTVRVEVDIFLNRQTFRNNNKPVTTNTYEFSVNANEVIGNIEDKINELLLTTDDYEGAVEENE